MIETYTKEITEDAFGKIIASDAPILVDVYGEDCHPCQVLAKQLPLWEDEICAKTGMAKIISINLDANWWLQDVHDVMAVPTLIVFHSGKELGRVLGVSGKKDLISDIMEMLKPSELNE